MGNLDIYQRSLPDTLVRVKDRDLNLARIAAVRPRGKGWIAFLPGEKGWRRVPLTAPGNLVADYAGLYFCNLGETFVNPTRIASLEPGPRRTWHLRFEHVSAPMAVKGDAGRLSYLARAAELLAAGKDRFFSMPNAVLLTLDGARMAGIGAPLIPLAGEFLSGAIVDAEARSWMRLPGASYANPLHVTAVMAGEVVYTGPGFGDIRHPISDLDTEGKRTLREMPWLHLGRERAVNLARFQFFTGEERRLALEGGVVLPKVDSLVANALDNLFDNLTPARTPELSSGRDDEEL